MTRRSKRTRLTLTACSQSGAHQDAPFGIYIPGSARSARLTERGGAGLRGWIRVASGSIAGCEGLETPVSDQTLLSRNDCIPEDRDGLPSTWLVDPFSSGISFPDRAELEDQHWMWPIRETYDPLMVRRPQTWLLREGWKRAGGAISARAVPSKPR